MIANICRRVHRRGMTRAYRLDAASQVIAEALEANHGPDPWCGGALAPGEFAPLVIRSQKTGQRVIRPMVWGYPAPGTDMAGNASDVRWGPTVRNVESPFWIGNLRHSELRCLVPATAFALHRKGKDHWFAVSESPIFAMAGIWRDLTDMPVFAILATDATGNVTRSGASSMPVILDAHNYDRWLGGDWKDAQHLLAPFAGALVEGA